MFSFYSQLDVLIVSCIVCIAQCYAMVLHVTYITVTNNTVNVYCCLFD